MHNFGGGLVGFMQFRGEVVKRGEGYFQNSGGSWLKGEFKKSRGGGGFGPWMKLCG